MLEPSGVDSFVSEGRKLMVLQGKGEGEGEGAGERGSRTPPKSGCSAKKKKKNDD